MKGHGFDRLDHRDDVAVHDCGVHSYLYVPHELLIETADLERLREPLDRLGAEPIETLKDLGVTRVRIKSAGVQAAVDRLRAHHDGDEPRVEPHHVLAGEPWWSGGPAVPPVATTDTISFEATGRSTFGDAVRVVVVDTGYTAGVHPDLDAHVSVLPAGAEPTDVQPQNGWLDDETGHGTFIAGIVARLAPDAAIEIDALLDSEGLVRELDVAQAIIRHADADVINLSLGGYTHGDRVPYAVATALRHVRFGSVVVAAAGNACNPRPFWPAAFKSVIAVAAIDGDGARARFSNYGPWVDCCAPGVDVCSAFVAFDETTQALNPPTLRNRQPQAFDGWALWSGTSFSAPYVSGRIAAHKAEGAFASVLEAAHDLIGGPGLASVAGIGVVVS